MTSTLRGHIENGKIVVDEGVDLPEGTQVKLTLVGDADDLDDEDRAGCTRLSTRRRPRSIGVKASQPAKSSPSSETAIDDRFLLGHRRAVGVRSSIGHIPASCGVLLVLFVVSYLTLPAVTAALHTRARDLGWIAR